MENDGAVEGAVVPHAGSHPGSFGLTLARDPNRVLADAHIAAKALKNVLDAKPADEKVMMGGKQYLEFEDWQTCGKFYNVFAKVLSTETVTFGNVMGFLARAAVFDSTTGQEISAAEAMCLNDEEKWSSRPKYDWVDELDGQGKKIWVPAANGKKGYYKGKRVKVGEVAVPLFQLRSMAQTRACAKALKNVLSWVVVLAGYRPQVAEEMTVDEHPEGKTEPVKGPERKAETTTQPATPHKASEPPADSQSAGKDAGEQGQAEDLEESVFVPEAVSEKTGKSDKGEWTKVAVKDPQGNWYSGFDKSFGPPAKTAKANKAEIVVRWKQDGQYRNIVSLDLK